MHHVRWIPGLLVAGVVTLFAGRLDAAPAAADPLGLPSWDAPVDFDRPDSLFSLAGQLYAERRFREAIPVFLQVVETDPRNGNAFALLGGAYFQLGDYVEAIGAFERAIELDEGIKLAYVGLVAANYLTSRVEAAQSWLVRMIPILTGEERDRYLATLSSQFPELTLPGS